MKSLVKSLTVAALAVTVLGIGAHKANAGNVDFSIGVNFGLPVAVASVYAAPARVYAPPPVRVHQVVQPCARPYRPVAYQPDRGWHRGWYGNDHYRNRGYDRWER